MVSESSFWEEALDFLEEDLDFFEEAMLGAVSGVWTEEAFDFFVWTEEAFDFFEEALDCFEETVLLDATVWSSWGFFEDATVSCVWTERSSLAVSSGVGLSVTKKSLWMNSSPYTS